MLTLKRNNFETVIDMKAGYFVKTDKKFDMFNFRALCLMICRGTTKEKSEYMYSLIS